ncbi:amino acid adenylation domain-containing protein [Streptomyces sp. NPDC005794]|uniref:amino acid adenylation domain-containing protein n=1 Tax=Streptomyces sp. NPDC005794 TaxID=3364733 RepID=UPI0036CB0EAB
MSTASVASDGLLALTRAQLGIWNAQRLEPDSPYYVVGDVVEISGTEPVDVDALVEAVRATTEEAETLRLRVYDTPEGPRQRVSEEPVEPPEVLDVSAAPDPAAAAQALVDAERARAGEECRGMVDRPLCSRTVIRLSDGEVWYTQLGHHLVFDGYTAAMLARRTGARYTALVRGREPARSTFGAVAGLVAADQAYRDSDRFAEDRAYWVERFTPLPELGSHDGSHDDPGTADGVPDRTLTARAVLTSEETARLREFADSEGVTWGEALIAGYAAFLHRMLARTDVVFALPLMCRAGSVELRTPAMAVNVLPLRVTVRGGDRLGELSRRVSSAMREMRDHQRYRGEDLPQDLGVPGAGALLHGRGINLKAFDLAIDFAGSGGVMRNVAGGPPEDMGLSVLPTRDGGLLLGFEVDARTHDQAAVDSLLAGLRTLLTALVDGRPVGQIAMTDDVDGLMAAWCPPALPGTPVDVPTAFDAMAAADPGHTALVCGDERLSAADLAGRVHRLARALRARGIGPDDVVALALPRSADSVTALLAVLDAGAAFLPLDAAYPPERLRGLIDDTRPALVVTDGTVDGLPWKTLLGEADGLSGAPLTADELAAPRHPEHLAYVIHTSGSTGRPKGVLGRAGGLAALLHHQRSTVVAEAEQAAGRRLRAAHTYSFAFDSAFDHLVWLLCGHELHVYDAETIRDADALLAAYDRDGVDIVDTTPSMALPLVEGGLLDRRPTLLVLGGEATPPALWRRVAESGTTARNIYGPTEATVDSTTARIDDGEPTIGHPLAGTRTYVLDSALQPVPPGTTGELYLAGPHLARGYLGRPGATADRFVADPFGAPGERMYRTGDLARWVPGRGLTYGGRGDGQIKIRGHRVETGEVESALAAVPGVTAAAARVLSSRLIGYVVSTSVTGDAVRAHLAERLPDHLVPAAVVVLAALPVTPNGKLDRAALPAPASAGGGREPRTERERLLCAVLAEAFEVERVGVDDDFFALGGDSITAITVSSRLRAAGLGLRPRDLLARRSFAALAASAELLENVPEPVDDPIGPVPAPPIVASLLAPHPDVDVVAGYAQWTALSVGALDHDDLVTGVQAVLDHHDALRLRADDGLEVLPRGAVPAVVDEVHGEDVTGLAGRLAGELDPRAGDLLRVALLRTGDGTPDRLVVVVHHLAMDGVSWRVLLPDLHTACTGGALEPVGTSWRRHALLLAGQGTSGARRGELDHWRAALASASRLGARPLDPARDTVATAHRSVTVASPEVTEALLTTLPTAYRAGVDEVLLAALVLALRGWGLSGDEVTVSMEGHGREHLDLARTIGWFTSEYPVRVPASGDVGRALRTAKEARRGVPDGGVGYGVLRHLDPGTAAELSATPSPDVLLNYLGRFAPLAATGWRLPERDAFSVTEPDAKALEQVLALNCFVHEEGAPRLAVEWTAATGVIGADVVATLQTAWAEALDTLAAHALHTTGGLTPSDLPLLDLDQSAIDALERTGRIADVLPATPLQVGLSFHTLVRDDDETDVYVVQAVTTLVGELDPDRMAEAAHELLRRHPALRVYLGTAGDDVVQVIPADVSLDWRADDRFPEAARADLERPFDPNRPPLIRFLLSRVGPAEHKLVITNHHALLDGWSMPLVGRTLLALYAELSGGPAAPTAPPLSEYFRWLAGRDREVSLTAWRDALAGVDEATRLAPTVTGGTGIERPGRETLGLGREFSDRIRAFAREEGVTLTTVLQTAWGLLLGRLTGRLDVLFGCPVSGRPAEVDGVESMIGQLGTTIPVRVRHTRDTTARDLMAQVHAESVALAEHHHVGLPEIQRATGIGELFDTMLVMENFPLSSRNRTPLAPGLDLAGVDITDATHYALTVIVIPGDDITIGLGYQPRAFDGSTVRDYGRWLHNLLREIVDDPARPAVRLPALDAGERDRMLRTGTGIVAAKTRGHWLDEFAAWAGRKPDAEALVCRDRSLSYAELDRQANRLAHALIARGVRPQDPVAVLLGRDVEMTVALFGVAKAGAVYVPMDASYPRERLAYMFDDIAPAAAVTTGAELPVARDVPVLRLDDPATLASMPDTDPAQARAALTEDALAYVIYTSGTTGRPKGVGVTHRGVPDLIALQEEVVGITEHDRYLHFASTSFDVAFWQTMVPLLSGGTSVIAPEEVRVPGDELLDYIVEHRVTGVNLLPSFLAAMPDDRTVDPDVFFVVGAERLDPELARRWGRGRRALFNAYGPTEVTINSTTWRYDPDDTGPLPIGRPDPDVRAYVLDGGLQPVGVGVTGELYLGGPSLARGYLGRPGLTAATFVADPFGPPGERVYRTGDLVRWRPDGQLVFLGRADHQIKIRGFRVELGEIESTLTSHPDVRAGVVITREGRLVGYVIPTDGADLDTARLRAHLAEQLPDHMVPTELVPIDRLPLGPGGKLDAAALPAPETTAAARREPATEAEAVLLGVFREVLGTDDIGLDDDFFAVGGDSIVSLQVVSRARRHGLGLNARDVFEGETVAGIAARTRDLDGAEAPAVGDAPLTPVMRDLLRRAGSAADGFCQWVEICVPPGGDEAAWQGVLDALLARHDVLRAHLADDVLRIPAVGRVTGADVLTRVPADGGLRAAADAATMAARESMDPRTGPLLRAVWVDAGRDRPGRLVLLAHHLVVDGVSWRVLLDDVEHAHSGGALARHGQSFLGWARSLHDADRRTELPHWQRMKATPALTRPLDPARDTVATATHHEIRLDAESTRALITTLPAAHRTTPDAVLLTALAQAVRAWRGTPRLLVALESHGRPRQVDLSQTVGWFTAVHPVLLDADDDVQAVRERLRAQGDGLGHGVLAAAGLLDPVEPEVAWNYLGRYPGAPAEETPWQAPPDADPLGSGGSDAMPLSHSLMVNALVRDDGLGVRITWPSALFTAAEIDDLAEYLRTALLRAAAVPEITELGSGRQVAEVQPLTPLQEVMLRHSRTERPDPYTVQSAFSLAGPLDIDALRAAGDDLLARHPNLGAVFPASLAVIPVSPRPDFRVTDGPADEVLAADLAESFDLGQGPLVRLTVIRLGRDRADLVLTTHHVLSDGWSAPRILTELFALYTARLRGGAPDLPAPVPFSGYLRWCADHEPDLSAWAAELDGLPEGDYLSGGRPGPERLAPEVIAFDPVLVADLTDLAARRGLTRNTLVQGAWSVLLARRSGRTDVCFGAMVACRPPELEGVEEIIGLLANTVPVRARLDGTLAETLAGLQARQRALVEDQHVALADLERLTGRHRLFDSMVVFENYPVDPERLREPAPGLRVVGTRFREATHHPVTLTVMPEGDGWTGVLAHRYGADVDGLAEDLLDLLRTLDEHLDRDVRALLEDR